MTNLSKVAELLPEGYGYVVLTGVGSIFVNLWMGRNVGKARKQFDIKYPKMYSEDNNEFNCIQRAHQQTLELHPSFMFLLLTAGLEHPRVAAGAGMVYNLGRIAYAKGYYTGDPSKRSRGFFGMFGMLVLLGSTVCFATKQVGFTFH